MQRFRWGVFIVLSQRDQRPYPEPCTGERPYGHFHANQPRPSLRACCQGEWLNSQDQRCTKESYHTNDRHRGKGSNGISHATIAVAGRRLSVLTNILPLS
ncbi:hypothetical protein UFOVP649_63 [uncultured Caudovirales phage]|uniref:Uncharacterized protein n=1 Tax=uncultured Caudovirales phage TaxID=2100421 RepID=A0A6J5NCZ5_9CAUD|nr:hypothetical protein UFOVP649_63 [uncultured Caudovirales phage]